MVLTVGAMVGGTGFYKWAIPEPVIAPSTTVPPEPNLSRSSIDDLLGEYVQTPT